MAFKNYNMIIWETLSKIITGGAAAAGILFLLFVW